MKKKGFTLIELLAVIVILAVIALIVTPIITKIIATAKENAFARSVEGHIANVEYSILTKSFASGSGNVSYYDVTNGALSSDITVPDTDNITCETYTIKNGKVTFATRCADRTPGSGWEVTFSFTIGSNASKDGVLSKFKGKYIAPADNEIHKGVVYIDPSNIENPCNENSTITNTNTGCKKFYVYKEENNNYVMIMDRNTSSGNVVWGSESSTEMGALATSLATDTEGWVGSPRLITGNEIAEITEYGNWWAYQQYYFYFGSKNQSDYYGRQSDYQKLRQRRLHWLFDYTNCTGTDTTGCSIADSSTDGYWINDQVLGDGDPTHAWLVKSPGYLSRTYKSYEYGVRPVITLSKSMINPTPDEVNGAFRGTYVAAQEGETHKGILYFDPSNYSRVCTPNAILTQTNTGCKRFYIYDDTGDYYTMIMDRNTTRLSRWSVSNSDITATSAESYLATDTAGWVGTARLITVKEVCDLIGITDLTNYDGTTNFYYIGTGDYTMYPSQTAAQQAKQRSFHWLFDYTNCNPGVQGYDTGCMYDSGEETGGYTNGYWTSNVKAADSDRAWRVGSNGFVGYDTKSNSTTNGVRPVLVIQKSLLNKTN